MSRFHRVLLVWSILVALPVLYGCSSGVRPPSDMPKLHPGKVTLNQEGSALAGATVLLYSADGSSKWGVGGTTDVNGSAELYTNGQFKGAPAGKYKVVVSKAEREPSKLPPPPPEGDPGFADWVDKAEGETRDYYSVVEKEFSDPKTTTLEMEVSAGKANEATLDVGKKVRNKM